MQFVYDLVSKVLLWLFPRMFRAFRQWVWGLENRQALQTRIDTASKEEARILVAFVRQESRRLVLPTNSLAVKSLISAGILIPQSSLPFLIEEDEEIEINEEAYLYLLKKVPPRRS